jgi:hypothetical protein
MILVTGFERSFIATQRADQIAEFAGLALKRILSSRRRAPR